MTAVKITYDLVNPGPPSAACTVEEIIIDAIGQRATSICELAEVPQPHIDLAEMLLEDTGFEYLFDDEMDGIEDDPARQATIGIFVPSVFGWFGPFNPSASSTPTPKHSHSIGLPSTT